MTEKATMYIADTYQVLSQVVFYSIHILINTKKNMVFSVLRIRKTSFKILLKKAGSGINLDLNVSHFDSVFLLYVNGIYSRNISLYFPVCPSIRQFQHDSVKMELLS